MVGEIAIFYILIAVILICYGFVKNRMKKMEREESEQASQLQRSGPLVESVLVNSSEPSISVPYHRSSPHFEESDVPPSYEEVMKNASVYYIQTQDHRQIINSLVWVHNNMSLVIFLPFLFGAAVTLSCFAVLYCLTKNIKLDSDINSSAQRIAAAGPTQVVTHMVQDRSTRTQFQQNFPQHYLPHLHPLKDIMTQKNYDLPPSYEEVMAHKASRSNDKS